MGGQTVLQFLLQEQSGSLPPVFDALPRAIAPLKLKVRPPAAMAARRAAAKRAPASPTATVHVRVNAASHPGKACPSDPNLNLLCWTTRS